MFRAVQTRGRQVLIGYRQCVVGAVTQDARSMQYLRSLRGFIQGCQMPVSLWLRHPTGTYWGGGIGIASISQRANLGHRHKGIWPLDQNPGLRSRVLQPLAALAHPPSPPQSSGEEPGSPPHHHRVPSAIRRVQELWSPFALAQPERAAQACSQSPVPSSRSLSGST